MGGQTFMTLASGNSAREAFTEAQRKARYDHGHSGYTGTIAEVDGFILIPIVPGEKPVDVARHLIDNDDDRIRDKWGPCGAIAAGKNQWLFFGWASS